MSRLLKSRDYLMKCLGFVLLFGFISLGAIGGCNNGGGQVGTLALTENDFADDPSLECDAEVDTCITFLESPFSDGVERDTHEIGTDIIPINFRRTVNLTMCWEDDNEDAEHMAMLVDSEGNEVLFLQTNNDCVSVIVEAGKHELIFAHDEKSEEEITVFVIPDQNGDLGANKTEMEQGIIKTVKRIFDETLRNIGFSKKARAQTVAENITKLLKNNACPNCDLKGANLDGRDISFDDITGAMLNEASMIKTKLYQTKIAGADFTDANLSLALWIDGSTCKPESTGVGIDNENNCNRGSPHQVTIKNNCNESIWIGVSFADGKPFLPVGGGPPLWGQGNTTPSWEIPMGQSEKLSLPYGFTSGVIAPRTGCVQEPMCCKNKDGTNCNVGKTCCNVNNTCLPTQNVGLQCDLTATPPNFCVENVALRCMAATCNDFNNCGQFGGADPATTFEMSVDQFAATGALSGDFYNVSMVAGNHIKVQVVPNDSSCDAVGVCKQFPKCPWARVVREDGTWLGVNARYRVPKPDETGVCLAPDKMAANSAYSGIPDQAPFFNLKATDNAFRRLGCVATDDDSKNCGDPTLEKIFYGCSPFAAIVKERPQPKPNDPEPGGCITEFGSGIPCTITNCRPTKLVDRGLLSGDDNAYSQLQICDPYGQCDGQNKQPGDTLNVAKWPAADCSACTKCDTNLCKNGMIEATTYLESVKAACNQFIPSVSNNQRGAYSWQFDDPNLVGLSGALANCPNPGVNYEVTLSCN